MRQIFQTIPWIHPEEPASLKVIYRQMGVKRKVRRGEVLKSGGESPKLFFLEKGLCAYFVADDMQSRPSVLALITPHRTMGDITCFTRDRVNVVSKAVKDSVVLEVDSLAVLEEAKTRPDLMIELTRHLIHKQECHLEGLLANYTLPAPLRVKTLFKALLTSHNLSIKPHDWNVIPLRLSTEFLAQVVNLSRASVSKILSQWQSEGNLHKEGLTLSIKGSLLDDVFDWRHGEPPQFFG